MIYIMNVKFISFVIFTGKSSMRILVVDDDPDFGSLLLLGLANHGHDGTSATTCSVGYELASSNSFDAIIVDRKLPDGDGLHVVRELRENMIMTPAICLSAMNLVDDRIDGLRAGGDDYLAKPFSFHELLARLETVTRRRDQPSETVLRVGDLEMDLIARTVTRAGVEIALMPREFRLLEFLVRRAGQVVTRSMLLEGIWKYQFKPETKILDVQLSRLRQKIDKGSDEPLIRTVRGAGYTIRAD
jgi:two-component system OmpR family response regulator